jgi:hypothetical protein
MHTFIVTFDDLSDFVWNSTDAGDAMTLACRYHQKTPDQILVVKILN